MENFFKVSNSIDLIEVQELLLNRYSNLDYILNLGFQEGYELIIKAYEKNLESKVWDKWLIDYRRMNKDTFISFEDYKSKMIIKDTNHGKQLSKEDILREAAEIEAKITNRKRGD